MPRSLRLQYPGAMYHLMNRGLSREWFAFTDLDFYFFQKGLAEISTRYKIDIYAFCLMSNHYHLLIRTEEANLSRAMRHFSHTFAQRVNRASGRDGPIFKGRFKSLLVMDEEYLIQIVRYIHLNPVSAGIAKSPEKYKWSSCRHYFEGKFPDWINPSIVLDQFHENKKHAINKLIDFTHQGNSLPLQTFYNRERLGPIVGNNQIFKSLDTAIVKGII